MPMLDPASGSSVTDAYLLTGRFGAAARLSPKALRLYAEQGLLVPARVDPATGYRYYAREQVPLARLIARLRQLGLPVARIGRLVTLSPEAMVLELRAWLRAQGERLAEQTEIVEAVARHVEGGPLAAIAVREVAASKVLYRQSFINVTQLDDFIATAGRDLRAHLREQGITADGALTVHYHDEITYDGEGRIEAAIAYDGSVEPAADLCIRLRPALREAYIPASADDAVFPQVLRLYDAVETWLDDNELTSVDSPYEIYPGTGGARFDVAYPINP
ncbi:MerR family transcriptional regulator [Allokutzneria albata]|uniref:DNA-binding transcriptional regulator, MerR family n=1 Tax=Allokutzneria albata TaxID=211114 RepID=A0A1G9W4X6_ALLAB|nr:MerR family transcriptional regulator [Allokutzneria albata]SDM79266.1 DNA-binding transcriptional regulator, MerR family [Allokutzneria albata]